MSDQQHETTPAPGRQAICSPETESDVDRESKAAEVVQGIHAMYSDALKIIGAGNAAGAVAAGAALHNFPAVS